MNERIRELANEAGFNDRGSNHTAYMNFYHEKFAELIVRECIEQVVTGPNGPAHYAMEAALRVRKHFGIEEHFGVE